MIRKIALICLTLVLTITFSSCLMGFTNTQSYTTIQDNEKPKVEIKENSDKSKFTIKYQLNRLNTTLILHSPKISNINLNNLEEQFKKENVDFNSKAQQIKINLAKSMDEKGFGELELILNSPTETPISFMDKNDLEISKTILNEEKTSSEQHPTDNATHDKNSADGTDSEKKIRDEDMPDPDTLTNSNVNDPNVSDGSTISEPQPDITRDPDWNSNWSKNDKLMVSKGFEKRIPT